MVCNDELDMDDPHPMTTQYRGTGQTAQTAPAQDVKREVIEFVKMVLWFLVLFFVLKSYVVEGYEVQGPSMQPTLENQERILVLKLPHVLSRYSWFSGIQAVKPGDVIVFTSTDDANKRYVKRVIAEGTHPTSANVAEAGGKPGTDDRVAVLIKRGELFVNNRRVDETYLPEEIKEPFEPGESDQASLKPGEYYVLGDNRGVSKDSRSFGPIDDDKIIGKAILRFWPLSKFSLIR